MPLWGTEDTLEGKPKIFGRSLLAAGITNDPRAKVYATAAGWVYPPVKAGGTPETLVAIRGLGTVLMGTGSTADLKANITSMNWNNDAGSYSYADGGTLSISVNFNEAITVTGGAPTLTVNNSARANPSFAYNAGLSTANRMTFIKTYGTNNSAAQAGDVLSVAGNNKVSAGGATIVGADGQAALITHTGLGPGDLTVVA